MNESTKESIPPLKPCPFCNREGDIDKGLRDKNGDTLRRPSAYCSYCQIRKHFDTMQEAAEWWNRRYGKKAK